MFCAGFCACLYRAYFNCSNSLATFIMRVFTVLLHVFPLWQFSDGNVYLEWRIGTLMNLTISQPIKLKLI